MTQFDGIIRHDESQFKTCGIDYTMEFEFNCKCGHRWRYTKVPKLPSCPKCHSLKVSWFSKRSIDEFFPEDSVIQIPQDSELM